MDFAGSVSVRGVRGDAWLCSLAAGDSLPESELRLSSVQPLPVPGSRARALPAFALGAPVDAAVESVSADTALTCLDGSRASEPRAAPAAW